MNSTISLNERENLLQQIDRLREPLREIASFAPSQERFADILRKEENYYANTLKHNPYSGCILVSFCITFGWPILYFIFIFLIESFAGVLKAFSELPLIPTLMFVAAFLVLVAVSCLASYLSKRSALQKSKERMETAKKNLAAVNRNLYDIASTIKNDITILPPDYQYSMAAEYIYSCLRNQRANTIGEAVNLYEDQLHKWRVENSLQQLTQIQKEQAASSRYIKATSGIAAAASVAGLFL